MSKSMHSILAKYSVDPVVSDLSNILVSIQLAKLRGRPIKQFMFDPEAMKEGHLVTIVSGDYEQEATLVADMLYRHTTTYYPELFPAGY